MERDMGNEREANGQVGRSGKSPKLNAGYQKADDCMVSLKRIEFALERVKLRGESEVKVGGEEGGRRERERTEADEKDSPRWKGPSE